MPEGFLFLMDFDISSTAQIFIPILCVHFFFVYRAPTSSGYVTLMIFHTSVEHYKYLNRQTYLHLDF